jgi:pimeloyl-ACP methyl ester carboxylesterase
VNPIFLGTRQRRLFGIYQPPSAITGPPRAALLCHPWGREYMIAYRSARQLGDMLMRAGFHVLRFDYFGTGDSGGDGSDASCESLERDIETALEELRDTSGVSRITLVGIRLGAALAARVAARRTADVRELVLWDPVVLGRDYLAELRLRIISDGYRSNAIRQPPTLGGELELRGHAMPDTLINCVRGLDLGAMADQLPSRTLAVVSSHHPSHADLAARFANHGGERSVEVVESQPAWLEDDILGPLAVPAVVLERILNWLGA